MRLQSLFPALAFLLSASPLVEAGNFGGSCRDNQIWQHDDGWHLSSLCKRYDGSENYSQLKLSFLSHVDEDGNLRWGPDGGFRGSIDTFCNDNFHWLSAGEVMYGHCFHYWSGVGKDTDLHLNDHIGNSNGWLYWDGYCYNNVC